MIGLIFLRLPIVHLLFEHGQFTHQATVNTASAVLFYAVGLWAFAGVRIIVPTFYSLQDTKTPVTVAVATMVINILLNLLLMKPMAHGGLALATSLSAMLNFIVLFFILQRRLGKIELDRLLYSILRTLFASLFVMAICWFASQQGIWKMDGYWFEKSILVAGALSLSVASYFLVHGYLQSEELLFFWNLIKERSVRGKRSPTPSDKTHQP
jgi:putative peptidoglycan lipid II flippase